MLQLLSFMSQGCQSLPLALLPLQAGNLLTPEMLLTMARDPVVFACANPVPEIDPELAAATRSDVIMATGRTAGIFDREQVDVPADECHCFCPECNWCISVLIAALQMDGCAAVT